MEYKWNKKRIILTYLLAKIRNDHNAIEQFQTMLNILNNNESKSDLIFKENDNLDLAEATIYYSACLHYINDDFYNDITDMYTWFDNVKILDDDIEFKTLNISNDELYEIVYDILKTFNDKEILKYYEFLLKNGYINFSKDKNILQTSTEKLGGLEIYDYYSKNGYINIYRNYTIEDILILLHEFMHSYFHHLIKPNRKDFDLLPELDGQFGSVYSCKYLTDNKFEDALILRKTCIDSILTSSYLMMINHTLITNNFNLENTNDELKELNLKYTPIIYQDELKDYLTVNGFTTSSNIISYLSVLDLINSNLSNEEILERMKLLRNNYTEVIASNLRRVKEITFYKDDYQNLFKEYNLTHK